MTDFSAAMAASSRTLSVRATLTLATGYTYSLTGDDILAYSLNEGASGGSMLLGSALSAHGALTLASPNGSWRPGGSKLGSRTLMGAAVQIEIGVLDNGEFLYAPAGSFVVSRVESAEGEDTVTLSGYDQLLHLLSPVFSDSLTYPCALQSILKAIAAQAGCTISSMPLCNANVMISAQPDWGENCTLRQALAWVCGAMGCFARLSRSGSIALIPLKSSSSRVFSAQNALSLTLEDTLFTFNRLRVMPRKGKEYVQSALNTNLPYGADNTLTIDDNPLFRHGSSELNTLVSNLCQALSGLSFTPFSMTATGDPTLAPGDFLTITDLRGSTHPAVIFSHQFTFADGLITRLACDLDSSGVSLPRIVTSSGTLSSAALTDGIIAARHIAAGAVDAEKITARSITADHIALGAITSDSGVIGQLNADNITAGKLSTDRLIVGGSEFSIVRALNQLAGSMSQNNNSIDGGVISDKSIDTNKVTDDFGAGLELSSNAAVLVLAGKLDGSHSHMELTEDAINMVGGEINIATNDLEIRGMDDGGEIMSLDPEGLSAKRVTVTEDFSAPNIVYSYPGKTAAWKGSVQKSLDVLPKYLTQDTTLTIPAGVYTEDVNIRGFYGSMLRLLFAPGATLHGSVFVRNCSHVVIKANTLGDAHIYPRSKGDGTVNFYAVTRAQISNMYISGYRGRTTADNGSDIALYLNSCHALVENCCLEYANKGLSANYSIVYAENTFGGTSSNDPLTNANLTYGVLASSGSHVYVVGDYPMGGKANTGEYRGVLSPYSLGDATPGGMEYVAPTQYVQSFAISKHCTYLYGVSRRRDDQTSTFSQGYYGAHTPGENNWRIGAMWFADAAAALQGKTIVSAQLTLRRASGGWSNAVGVYLGSVALPEADFATTLKPAFTAAAAYPIGTLKRESEDTYDVTSLISAIQAGHAIGVYEPRSSYSDNWSPAYTNFYGKGSAYEPVLTVTYK